MVKPLIPSLNNSVTSEIDEWWSVIWFNSVVFIAYCHWVNQYNQIKGAFVQNVLNMFNL